MEITVSSKHLIENWGSLTMHSDDRHFDLVLSEDGGMTAFGIFLLLVTLMIGGLGLDVTNAIRERTQSAGRRR